MKAFTVNKTERRVQVPHRITAMMADIINNANLFVDDDGYIFHAGVVNRSAWQVTLLQLLGRGYTVSESIKEIEKLGVGPNRSQSISNMYYKTKLAILELKFRVDNLTTDAIMKLRSPPRGIPTNATEHTSGMYATFHAYDITLMRNERAGAPMNGAARNTDVLTKNDMHLLKKIKREVDKMGWINTTEEPADVDHKLVEILDRMYERHTTTVREWIRWNQE